MINKKPDNSSSAVAVWFHKLLLLVGSVSSGQWSLCPWGHGLAAAQSLVSVS